MQIRPVVVHIDRYDDRAVRIGRQMHVVRGTESAVGHLHHPCARIRARCPRLSLLLPVVRALPLLGLFHLFESPFDPPAALLVGSLPRALLASPGWPRDRKSG